MDVGVDLEMMMICYIYELKGLIEEGKLFESFLDEVVFWMLILKNDLGLFEDFYCGLKNNDCIKDILIDDSCGKVWVVGIEFVVLLENKNWLFLLVKEVKIVLVGLFVMLFDIFGGWNVYGEEKDGINVEIGLCEVFEMVEVVLMEYIELLEEDKVVVKVVVENMDVVVFVLGEKNEWGGEVGSFVIICLLEV